MNDLESYYSKRAEEHDLVYQKPERQNDLKTLKTMISQDFLGLEVLDLGCGSGYWTQELSIQTQSIVGIDINNIVLKLAASKPYNCPVSFTQESYYQLEKLNRKFEGVFAGFVYSHIPKERRIQFFESIFEILKPGGIVVCIDNLFVEGSSTPIQSTDALGNTYQKRVLTNGQVYTILKNFPHKDKFQKDLPDQIHNYTFQELEYYWLVKFQKN